ncbi:trypsin-like serine protease [Neoconidiobolus thromboides FSU 785]|nr:trypsin-like serine protease [Neoconidiobolus thromboides FSU 785]
MKSALIFTLLGAAIAADIPFTTPPGRIVGGYEVSPKFKYPWMVSLAYGGSHSCGGTLYNGNTVISAAHCVIGSTSSWTARVHRHNLNTSESSEQGKTYKIKSRISHPSYNSNTNAYDVSIWKLDTATGPSTGVKLDAGNYANTDNTLLKVIGWGTTSSGGNVSPVLLEVKVPVFNAAKCKQVYSVLDTKTQFCAGYPEGGKDSCQGDSGGPMFIEEGTTPVLVGIVSWGEGCALKGKPGVYTRASAVADFINKNSS